LLEGENRILVKHGLQRLKSCRRPGICALMEVAGITLGEEITPFDIGFKLGPRINASGRLDDASVPIQLLLSEDWNSCHETANLLDSSNRERQEIERAITLEAEDQVVSLYADDHGVILHSSDWHAGVVGIVASRIARKFNRPALVLGSDSEGLLKGSGRSIDGVDLVDILQNCTDHIVQWGGHPMAIGLTTEEGRLAELRQAFNEALRIQFPDGLPEPVLKIDANLDPDALTETLLAELDQLSPYGQGNPEPIFALENVTLTSVSALGQDHIRFSCSRPGGLDPIDGVAWNMAGNPPPVGRPVKLAVRFHWHAWRGRRSARLTLLDWRGAD
ncbi:MAG TPA: DHHA1 domain-containing protein, partial [Oceanipulchritudo sp.]|nr:DHHA1 domain-containing protein [Oceanipulchritudo sp.]